MSQPAPHRYPCSVEDVHQLEDNYVPEPAAAEEVGEKTGMTAEEIAASDYDGTVEADKEVGSFVPDDEAAGESADEEDAEEEEGDEDGDGDEPDDDEFQSSGDEPEEDEADDGGEDDAGDDGDDGDGDGGDGDGGDGDDDDIGTMYAGAGPQDLPDNDDREFDGLIGVLSGSVVGRKVCTYTKQYSRRFTPRVAAVVVRCGETCVAVIAAALALSVLCFYVATDMSFAQTVVYQGAVLLWTATMAYLLPSKRMRLRNATRRVVRRCVNRCARAGTTSARVIARTARRTERRAYLGGNRLVRGVLRAVDVAAIATSDLLGGVAAASAATANGAGRAKREARARVIEELKREAVFPVPPAVVLGPGSGGLRSRKPRSAHEVTIVTQCSVDRLPQLREMALAWDGILSVAIHAPSGAAQARHVLASLHAEVEAASHCRLDVTFVTEACEGVAPEVAALYPINRLRNAALDAAETQRVFLLDVDFVPSAGLHRFLCSESLLASSQEALVVPAYELLRDGAALPRERASMAALARSGGAQGFHTSHFPAGHAPTDFARWEDAALAGGEPLTPYPVSYKRHFEPYVVMRRDCVPRYDERFRGYGLNKICHLRHVDALGVRFAVATAGFVVARPHGKSDSWQRTYGRSRSTLAAMRVQALFNRFVEQLGAAAKAGRVPLDPAALPPLEAATVTRDGASCAAQVAVDMGGDVSALRRAPLALRA